MIEITRGMLQGKVIENVSCFVLKGDSFCINLSVCHIMCVIVMMMVKASVTFVARPLTTVCTLQRHCVAEANHGLPSLAEAEASVWRRGGAW